MITGLGLDEERKTRRSEHRLGLCISDLSLTLTGKIWHEDIASLAEL